MKAAPDVAPPRETFWTKYSPHHEFESALSASVVLQTLLFVAIFLVFGGGLFAMFQGEPPLPPAMNVAFVASGGDGAPPGGGSLPGAPGNQSENVVPREQPKTQIDAAPLPSLDPIVPPAAFELSPDIPFIGDTTKSPDFNEALRKIESNLKPTTPPSPNTGNGQRGQGGKGIGPGTGLGKGSGDGPGDGIGGSGGTKGNATDAEIFAKRWRFNFTGTPQEHVKKLLAAGVVVGFKDGNDLFWIITDLKKRPVAFHLEPFEKYDDAVKWRSQNPQSVLALSQELRMPAPPAFFLLLVPKDRQQRLANAEMQFSKDRNRDVSQVTETWFDIRPVGGSFEPVVVSQVPFDPRPKW